MNTAVLDANGNAIITEVEEVEALADDATDEQKAAHTEKLESNNKQLYARLKKSEGFVQDKDGKWVKPPKKDATIMKTETTTVKTDSDLSQKDLITLMKADIHDDDVEQVIKFAKFEGITVAEALNNDIVKGILDRKAEARKVADGTNTGNAKRGNAKVSDEALMENARKGKMPESDEDMKRLTTLMRPNTGRRK